MDFGVAFNTPQGWIIQTPQKQSSDTPDIVVAGPKIGNISPALTVTITKSQGNLSQDIENFKKQIQPLIDQGVITIQTEYSARVAEKDAHVMITTANFENQNGEIMELAFATTLLNNDNVSYQLQYMNTQEIV